jgi:predicted metalloprotease
MRLDDERESSNVEDRRGLGGGFPGGGFPGGGIRIGGIGAIVLVVGALLLGVDPSLVLSLLSGQDVPATQQTARNPPPSGTAGQNDPERRFVARVLASTEDVWGQQFQAMGRTYEQPRLVLFTGGIQSGCGFAQTAVGPFYCPADHRVYLDLAFFRDLQNKLGAGGDFAQAYVIAHEVGHHVQNLLGIMQQVNAARARTDQAGRNALSVRVELQADCLAGVWANQANEAKQILEKGDVEEGLTAAAAVGDDRLQRRAQGVVVPESFTHGSSEQRVRWFRRGLSTGRPDQCNTFAAQRL